MVRYWLVFVFPLLLSGCGWFTSTPAPAATPLPISQPIQVTLSGSANPRPTLAKSTSVPTTQPSPTATTPLALPTLTPTLRPIAVSLLPLPTPIATASLKAITGTLLALPPGIVTTTIAFVPTAQPALRAELSPTPDGVARTRQVPILMYHYLSTPPADADIYRRDLSVKPELFAAHLALIRAAGYTTISLYDLLAALTQGAPLPERPVILTFDDGYRDNYENAFPLLKAQGMTATFFIVTDFIDQQRPEYLTWKMVREMHDGGMSIESHGRNHVRLRGKDKDYLIWQALGSAETIQAEIGVRPHFICYPSGEYDQLTIDIFQSAHYWAGLTTVQGATHSSEDLFELRRLRVRGTTTPEELERLLGVDW